MGILEGKIAVITGASSGVGYGCAVRFAEEGANVVACARRMERLEKLRDEAAGMAGTIIPQRCDIGVEADLDTVVKNAVEMFGTIDILANAGRAADKQAAWQAGKTIFRHADKQASRDRNAEGHITMCQMG